MGLLSTRNLQRSINMIAVSKRCSAGYPWIAELRVQSAKSARTGRRIALVYMIHSRRDSIVEVEEAEVTATTMTMKHLVLCHALKLKPYRRL